MSAIGILFTDTMSVRRKTPAADGELLTESETETEKDVPCRLSRRMGLSGSAGQNVPPAFDDIKTAVRSFVIFAPAGTDVRAGDMARVSARGMTLELRCGAPMAYAEHTEIPAEERSLV